MKTRKRWCIVGIVIGAILSLGPAWGTIGTVLGMGHLFSALGQSGIADPNTLANGIGRTLIFYLAGFILCPVGLVILVLSIIFYNRVPKTPSPPLPVAEA